MKCKCIWFALILSLTTPSFAGYMKCNQDCGNEEPCCCYVPQVEYRQESFDIPECCLVPELKYCRKKRYKLKYYKQKFIKYVPQVYEKTIARYEPEYYFEAYYDYQKCGYKTRCCQSVPYTVYKKCKVYPSETQDPCAE